MPSFGPISSLPISSLPARTVTTVTVNEDSWHQGWSIPRSSKIAKLTAVVAIAASGLFYTPFVEAAEEVTVDKWYKEFSEPKRFKLGLRAGQQDVFEVPQNPTVSFSWFQPISTPKPLPKKTILAAAQHSFEFNPRPEVSIGWYRPFETPVLKKRAFQGDYSSVPYVAQVEVVTVDKWYLPFENPRKRLGLLAGDQGSFEIPSNPTVSFGWNEPFSEPVRQKLGLKTHLQQFLAFVKADPFPEETTVDRWHQPFSQRLLKRAPLQLGAPESPYAPPAEIVTVDKWFEPFSERLRAKPGLRAAYQNFYRADTDPVVSFSWYGGLSEPKRFKAGIRAASQVTSVVPGAPADPLGWYSPLSQKPLPKAGLAARFQQSFTIDPFILTQPEFVSEDKWHSRWPDFALKKKRHPSLNEGYSSSPYFMPPEVVTVDKWYQWLGEPKRFKRGLRPDLQQVLALVKAAPFGETIFEDKWHQPWSEPTRRKGIKVNQIEAQPYFFKSAAVSHNVTLDATETPDTASFVLSISTLLVEANVSVVELVPQQANTSVISPESGPYASVAIIEIVIPEQAAAGVIVDGTIQANVSIIEISV